MTLNCFFIECKERVVPNETHETGLHACPNHVDSIVTCSRCHMPAIKVIHKSSENGDWRLFLCLHHSVEEEQRRPRSDHVV